MTAHQAALGDRDNPTPATSVPVTCQWLVDPDGDLILLPGCWSRVNDPDAECTCDKLGARLERAERELAQLRRHHEGLSDWKDAITAAVYAHPDGVRIMHDASKRIAP